MRLVHLSLIIMLSSSDFYSSVTSIGSTGPMGNLQKFKALVSDEVELWIDEGRKGFCAKPDTWCGYIHVEPPVDDEELATLDEWWKTNRADWVELAGEEVAALKTEEFRVHVEKMIVDRERRRVARQECDAVVADLAKRS